MPIKFGPILKLWDSNANSWTVSVLIGQTVAAVPLLEIQVAGISQPTVKMEKIATRSGLKYFRGLIEVILADTEQELRYCVGGKSHIVMLPGANSLPRLAYTSCNGFHTGSIPSKLEGRVAAMWESLQREHSKNQQYNLLIMGGDQVYADTLVEGFEKDQLGWHWYTPKSVKKNFVLKPKQRDWLEDEYSKLYTRIWQMNRAMMEMFATCPTLMMWDDHDIMDGWGSQPDRREKWPVYKDGVYPEARKAFLLFQQHCRPGESPPSTITAGKNLTSLQVVGSAAILNLDARSERTPDQILSSSNWKRINKSLGFDKEKKNLNGELKHLFVCLSVPVVYANLEWLEHLLNVTPGDQGIEDDLRDHWRSRHHRGTRLKLLKDLFKFSQLNRCRVTLISGDVHVAAHGTVRLEDGKHDNQRSNRIHQLISSPVLNTPGHPLANMELARQGSSLEQIDATMTAEMSKLDFYKNEKTTSTYFVSKRNWLSLIANDDNAYKAEWFIEEADEPFKVVINACENTA
ncbi:MAG: alkaline phosphatase D family protein [Akkermansiaceae bacterium]